jgi:hypothetical protein
MSVQKEVYARLASTKTSALGSKMLNHEAKNSFIGAF